MTQLIELLVAGTALGCIYALVALGFVIIYKSTGVFNFAQGDFLMVGGYLVLALGAEAAGLPFYVAVPVAMGLTALLGLAVERGLLRFMIGKPAFAVLMLTIGLGIVLRAGVLSWAGFDSYPIGDPWGAGVVSIAGVTVTLVNIYTIATTAVVVVVLSQFFIHTRYGVAMRATAQDQEAALALGVPVRRVFALAWALSAVLATIAGTFLSGFPRALEPTLGVAALRSLPGALLGGLDSIPGAVVGGVLVGVVEVMVAGYQREYAPWLGRNFYLVAPYLVLLVVLWTRPAGLFGSKEVIRV